MNEQERSGLSSELRRLASIDGCSASYQAASQIEADGKLIDGLIAALRHTSGAASAAQKRSAELETALGIAVRTMDCLIGDLSAHKDCDECQENVASYSMALSECRAALGEDA